MSQLFKEFRAFVFATNDDTPIHHEGGWCSCAVGEFHKAYVDKLQTDFGISNPYQIPFEASDNDIEDTVMDLLSVNGEIHYMENCSVEFIEWVEPHVPYEINTYGALKEFIKLTEDYFS